MKRIVFLLLIAAMTALLLPALAQEAPETRQLRILATSDLHGKFMPWDYALNAESTSGSMAQLASAIKEYRTENTLLVDAGDSIQDNAAEIFFGQFDVHPMAAALNAIGYDLCVTGNHEFNYGMDTLRSYLASLEPQVLSGNVYDETGARLAEPFTVFDMDGVRVAVIGMVTPAITRWDALNLENCTVTDALAETRAAIEALEGRYDILVGVFHMGLGSDYGLPNSGVEDILNACPEFDVMVASHGHVLIPSMEINGALVVENKSMAQTMSVIDLTLIRDGDGWRVADKQAESVQISAYAPDPELTEVLAPYHAYALADAQQVIGRLTGGPLVPEDEIAGIPTLQVQDTALVDLINRVQLYYSGAQVSATAVGNVTANLLPGDIHKCDVSLIYRYTNTLYTLRMTGAQLKTYMEWSASYYNTLQPEDLTVSFDASIPVFNYDMFAGVCYEVNVAREPGSRIENLTWPDGTPVADDDVFNIAVNNYRATTQLLAPGAVFAEDDMPILIEIDVRDEIGGIRELIREYIRTECSGELTPECDDSWRLTGIAWDEDMHRRVAELVAAGVLTVPVDNTGRSPNAAPITVEDLTEAESEAADDAA